MYTRGLHLFFKAEINQAFQVIETSFQLSAYILAHNHFDLDILSFERHFEVERSIVSLLNGMSSIQGSYRKEEARLPNQAWFLSSSRK